MTLALEYALDDGKFGRAGGTRGKGAEVRIRRGEEERDGGFGFTIRGGSYGPDPAKNRPLTVTHIRPGGPADREGRLRVGDRILAIDGADVSSATLYSASQLVAQCATTLTLSIQYDVSVLGSLRPPPASIIAQTIGDGDLQRASRRRRGRCCWRSRSRRGWSWACAWPPSLSGPPAAASSFDTSSQPPSPTGQSYFLLQRHWLTRRNVSDNWQLRKPLAEGR